MEQVEIKIAEAKQRVCELIQSEKTRSFIVIAWDENSWKSYHACNENHVLTAINHLRELLNKYLDGEIRKDKKTWRD